MMNALPLHRQMQRFMKKLVIKTLRRTKEILRSRLLKMELISVLLRILQRWPKKFRRLRRHKRYFHLMILGWVTSSVTSARRFFLMHMQWGSAWWVTRKRCTSHFHRKRKFPLLRSCNVPPWHKPYFHLIILGRQKEFPLLRSRSVPPWHKPYFHLIILGRQKEFHLCSIAKQ